MCTYTQMYDDKYNEQCVPDLHVKKVDLSYSLI